MNPTNDERDGDDWLEKIRRKPQRTKQFYALGTAAAITAVILVFWILTLKFESAGQNGLQSASNGTAASVTSDGSPLDTIQKEFSQIVTDFQQDVSSTSADFSNKQSQ